jgi:hypothetical protein
VNPAAPDRALKTDPSRAVFVRLLRAAQRVSQVAIKSTHGRHQE